MDDKANPRQLYEKAVSVTENIFYRIFKAPKYQVRGIPNVMGAYRASLANGESEPFVDLTIWDTGGLPRISIGTSLEKARNDVSKLADKIEKERVGYISWECDFARREKRPPKLFRMLGFSKI